MNKSLSLWKPRSNKALSAFYGQKSLTILTNIIVFLGFIPHGVKPASAQTILKCDVALSNLLDISNNAVSSYTDETNGKINRLISDQVNISANINSETKQPLSLVNQGIEDLLGNSVVGLNAIAASLIEQFKKQGLNEEDANLASLTTISTWAALGSQTSSLEVVAEVKRILNDKIIAQETQELIAQIPDTDLLTALSGLQSSNLKALGLTNSEIEIAGKSKITPQNNGSFIEQIASTTQLIAQEISPEAKAKLINAQKQYEEDLTNLRQDKQTVITSGSQLRFKFRLNNQSEKVVKTVLPNAQAITANGLTGSGQVTKVVYRLRNSDGQVQSKDISATAETVSIPANKFLELDVEVKVGKVSKKLSAITLNLQPSCGNPTSQSLTILPPLTIAPNLIDPLGTITGCAGQLLPEYLGFSTALYDPNPNDPTGSSISNITSLTPTELPDDLNNDRPLGLKPNIENNNPFFLTNSDQGQYSFLLDEKRQQLDVGKTYILVVKPPENSIYSERRVKLVINERQGNVVKYTASSLDGKPIRASDGQTTITGEIILVEDAERVGLDLAVLDLSTSVCDAQEIQITKTGDRATAEPGDTVLYRLAIRNLASAPISKFQITDTLPIGFNLQTDSLKAEVKEQLIPITATQSDRIVNFTTDITLNTNEVINLVYAAQLTANALRGSGQNSAIVNAQRTDNNNPVQDGPAIHNLRIEPGIIENTGILIGRVFVDKNFDGEQQPGEPGIPEAVIYLEDGNRVITDAEGLFSVANLLPGNHTGILDLTSIPEYRLAPNLRFSERNSKSRLVKLEPGGMVRMNFGVTPTAAGKKANLRREIPPQPKQTQPKSESTRLNADF